MVQKQFFGPRFYPRESDLGLFLHAKLDQDSDSGPDINTKYDTSSRRSH